MKKTFCQSPEDRQSQNHSRDYQAETVAAEKEVVQLVTEVVEESQPLPERMAQEIAVAEGVGGGDKPWLLPPTLQSDARAFTGQIYLEAGGQGAWERWFTGFKQSR